MRYPEPWNGKPTGCAGTRVILSEHATELLLVMLTGGTACERRISERDRLPEQREGEKEARLVGSRYDFLLCLPAGTIALGF